MSIVFYISGHGFGHASRQIEIINAFAARRPDVAIVVRTSADPRLFERTATTRLTLIPGACDTGVAQIDSLRLDEARTIREARAFQETFAARARDEAALLRAHDARLVIADAPPLACLAAAEARVPAIVVANFTWDWIYRAYASQPGADEVVRAAADAYRLADAAWRLPMHGGFDSCRQVTDVSLVARHATREPVETRRILGLADGPLALVSFGGFGIADLDLTRVDGLDRWTVAFTTRTPVAGLPRGVNAIAEDRMYAAALRYEDLVRAADVVVSKPGYGIISECAANDTALVYTSRGRFPEYAVLVEAMPRMLRCAYLDRQDLLAGHWRAALDLARQAPAPVERPATDGADVIAEMIAGSW